MQGSSALYRGTIAQCAAACTSLPAAITPWPVTRESNSHTMDGTRGAPCVRSCSVEMQATSFIRIIHRQGVALVLYGGGAVDVDAIFAAAAHVAASRAGEL